ncbi:hypothetical protein [Methylorubrum suomiense]|uniref:hypothetical protein n=1 Tax=Methylorubrum suomiense TaxID=144191 RepID=UPI0010F5C334|nr:MULTISPECIES: hypothetical protein [Methylobacteriaceae]
MTDPAGREDHVVSQPITSEPTKPGDEAAPGTPGSGENLCRSCAGSGRTEAGACPDCKGTGKVTTGIGGG